MEIDFYDVHKYLLDSFRLQVMLGLSGVILVMLSVIGSVGFFSVLGIKSTLIIMEVIPSSTNKFFFYTMMLLISSFFGCDGALFLFFRRFQLIGYMYLLCCLDWVPLFLVV